MVEFRLLSQNISELAPRIKAREVSPVEVTQVAIAHAERMQPILKSFITLTPRAFSCGESTWVPSTASPSG